VFGHFSGHFFNVEQILILVLSTAVVLDAFVVEIFQRLSVSKKNFVSGFERPKFSFLLFFRKTTPFEKKEEKTLRRNPRGETPSRPRKRGKRTFAMASDNPKTRFPSKKKFWSSFSSLASALLFFFFDDVFFTKSFKPDAKALPLLVAT